LIEKKVENNKFEFELVKENEKIASSKAKAFKDEMSFTKKRNEIGK